MQYLCFKIDVRRLSGLSSSCIEICPTWPSPRGAAARGGGQMPRSLFGCLSSLTVSGYPQTHTHTIRQEKDWERGERKPNWLPSHSEERGSCWKVITNCGLSVGVHEGQFFFFFVCNLSQELAPVFTSNMWGEKRTLRQGTQDWKEERGLGRLYFRPSGWPDNEYRPEKKYLVITFNQINYAYYLFQVKLTIQVPKLNSCTGTSCRGSCITVYKIFLGLPFSFRIVNSLVIINNNTKKHGRVKCIESLVHKSVNVTSQSWNLLSEIRTAHKVKRKC